MDHSDEYQVKINMMVKSGNNENNQGHKKKNPNRNQKVKTQKKKIPFS